MAIGSSGRGFRFGIFELDLEAGQLRRDGLVVKLAPQPLKLLTLLVERAGAVVTREEIRAALWSTDTFVDFDQGVNFAIRQLRDALGDSADNPRFVQTLPRRGYRFLGAAEPLGPARGANLTGRWSRPTDVRLYLALWANVAELKLAAVRRRRWLKVGVIVAVSVLLALAAVLAAVR
jgi:DNA-binding winged helix-turn-helix (wHTH) protein